MAVLEILGLALASALGMWVLVCLMFGLYLEATRPEGGSPEEKQWFVVLILFSMPFMVLRDRLRTAPQRRKG
jgi:hypothetical protein